LCGGLAAAAAFIAGRLDRARSEAAGLYVMVTSSLSGPTDEPVFTRFQIFNKSALPAMSVGVEAWDWGRRRVFWRVRRHRNWMTGRFIVGRVYNTIAPESETEEELLPGLHGWGPPGEAPPVLLVFRDGLGRQWVRWPDGKLTRLVPSLLLFERRKRLEALGAVDPHASPPGEDGAPSAARRPAAAPAEPAP